MELDEVSRLPRFNTPLELGADPSPRLAGRLPQRRRKTLILDSKPSRYDKTLSDMSGMDVEIHGNDVHALIRVVRDWLNANRYPGTPPLPGAVAIGTDYDAYLTIAPDIVVDLPLDPHDSLPHSESISTSWKPLFPGLLPGARLQPTPDNPRSPIGSQTSLRHVRTARPYGPTRPNLRCMNRVSRKGGDTVRRRRLLFATLLTPLAATPAHAAWPDRPIHLIVPFAPGGGVDTTGRLLAQRLTERLGQTVLVENHPGAGSNVGNGYAARAAPDGYTLLLASPSAAINASLYRNLTYDLRHDFVAVAGVVSSELVLAVAPDSPLHTLAGLLALARQQPGKLAYASAGIGSTEHLAGEMLRQMAGIDILHVAYKGTGQAINDVRGGQVQFLFGGASAMVPLVRGGQLRALAVTSPHRLDDLPDVPTMQEAGVLGYEVTLWNGILAPKATPAAVVAQLNQEISAAVVDLTDRFHALGAQPMPMAPAALQALIDQQITQWQTVITQANVHVD